MVEVHPLLLATVLQAEEYRVPQVPDPLPVYAFLICDGNINILMDTGVGTGVAVINKRYQPQRFSLVEALALHQVALADIDHLVNSHLHFDHCGNNVLFSGLDIVVHEAELAAAQAPGYTVPDWVNFAGANYTTINAATQLSANVTAMPTPGHTPGHLSLEIRQAAAWVDLVVAQAAYSSHEFDSFFSSQQVTQPGMWNIAQAQRSLQLLSGKRVRRAYFSHDPKRYENTLQESRAE